MPSATTNGFNQWAIAVPGQMLRVPVTAGSEQEALEKFKRGEWDKPADAVPAAPETTPPPVPTPVKE